MRLLDLTALQLGRAIRAGEASAEEAAQAALDAIAARQPEHNAYITVLADQALERAQALAAASGSPLAVPAGVKDNICTLGVKTSCASKILGDFAPPYDATVMEKFHAAGGVMLGKLNMDEFAMGSTTETSFYGPVRNPWDPTGCPAAPPAAPPLRWRPGGECWYALGSDTGGSIRQPAAHCGVTGMKPTYGTVSRYGLIAYASSLDQIGPSGPVRRGLCRSAGHDPGPDERDGTSLMCPAERCFKLSGDLTGMKIGHSCGLLRGGAGPGGPGRCCAVAQVLKGRGPRWRSASSRSWSTWCPPIISSPAPRPAPTCPGSTGSSTAGGPRGDRT